MWRGLRDFVIPGVYDEALSYQEILAKVIHEINDLWDVLSGKLSQKLIEKLNQIMVDIVYNEEDECIIFKLTNPDGGDVHEFDPDTGTMYIKEKD